MSFMQSFTIQDKTYNYFSITDIPGSKKLPFSLKILLENILRHANQTKKPNKDIQAIIQSISKKISYEIAYRPARVLMQDFTGVPAIVDLAAMRDAMKKMNKDPTLINPLIPVDLVIDHSVIVDYAKKKDSFQKNVQLEFERNQERYTFLKWGQKAFKNFQVVPPGTGICHQVNLEYLAQVVWKNNDILYPDTLVGTDSHTTMINALGVLGWGVGGIEAEAAMLGQPCSMLIPDVIGFQLIGSLSHGVTATDLVLTITDILRKKGVIGKFVEFYGIGLEQLPIPDRATISNMAPEYGATCGFFPVDQKTLDYLEFTGREKNLVKIVEIYTKAQGLWRDKNTPDPIYTDTITLDLSSVVPCLAGPRRPQDRVPLSDVKENFLQYLQNFTKKSRSIPVAKQNFSLTDGDVVIAAITSCTNTSNPGVLIAAGLVARKAREKGLMTKPWVKTSFAPGSQVVTDYLEKSGLQNDLDALGFNLVGYGCTTCIGNSGPLPDEISSVIIKNNLIVNAVLSGNRNFEGRVNPQTRGNYLASPPLVIIYALTGTLNIDLLKEPIGQDKNGNSVYLKDIWWNSQEEIQKILLNTLTPVMFRHRYENVFQGTNLWKSIQVNESVTYEWNKNSTYIQKPPFFDNLHEKKQNVIKNAKLLAVLGDSVTTDHISPAGSFSAETPAGIYLIKHGIPVSAFNSYGSRRGNHEIMMRGTLANIRIKNELTPEKEGGFSKYQNTIMPIYDVAMHYQKDNTPLIIIGGKEYGTGSSRDWAAKGVALLGVKAVIVESFERIHRSNLVGMGILPLQFKNGQTRHELQLTGNETLTIVDLDHLQPGCDITCIIQYSSKIKKEITLLCRIDTLNELAYYQSGGILHYVLSNNLNA